MAMKLVCDRCGTVMGKQETVFIHGNGTISKTDAGIYLSGNFRVARDGKGEPADVCRKCVLLILSDADVRDGGKPREAL